MKFKLTNGDGIVSQEEFKKEEWGDKLSELKSLMEKPKNKNEEIDLKSFINIRNEKI